MIQISNKLLLLSNAAGLRSGSVDIVIGTHRLLQHTKDFHDVGLIIVDEEHDGSFKQQNGLRYSARDLAIVRARKLDIPVILGSAIMLTDPVFGGLAISLIFGTGVSSALTIIIVPVLYYRVKKNG